ncbi:hypothetical protein [Calothrix sp. UHCC 0171]|uniref:hypothetical protein n=1 Tax=Calothrix sp. UHCC 0171 TaxID=3110245 RepID=UPI003A5239D2
MEIFPPRGAYFLWVSDTGHHQLLEWKNLPTHKSQPADWVIGQTDMLDRHENGGATASASSAGVMILLFGKKIL